MFIYFIIFYRQRHEFFKNKIFHLDHVLLAWIGVFIGPGSAWTKDQIEGRTQTEDQTDPRLVLDRTGSGRTRTGPDRSWIENSAGEDKKMAQSTRAT